MARFKVGEYVFVPNAYEAIWKTTLSRIEEIETENNVDVYLCKVLRHNLAARSDPEYVNMPYQDYQVFPRTEQGKQQCDEYVSNYYYGGLCNGCKYEEIAGQIWKCTECEHCIADEVNDPTKPKPMRCEFTGIIVSEFYRQSHSVEACKKFSPFRPQHKRDFNSWEQYNDYLMNCEFNKNCIHHKESAWKTCTYEHYMDEELIKIPFSFVFHNREVTGVKITRRRWIEQSFLLDGKLHCYSVHFKYQLNKRGLPRKEDQPIFVSFPVDENDSNGSYKEVIIDIESGEMIGETGSKI